MAKRLEIRGGPGEHDLMAWPDPRDPEDLAWRLRYQQTMHTVHDCHEAAAYIEAYRALISLPQKVRNNRIEQMKAQMKREGGE